MIYFYFSTGSTCIIRGNNLDVLLVIVTVLLVSEGSPLYAAGASSAEGRGDGELDVLLGVETHHEGRNIDESLSNTEGNKKSREGSSVSVCTFFISSSATHKELKKQHQNEPKVERK